MRDLDLELRLLRRRHAVEVRRPPRSSAVAAAPCVSYSIVATNCMHIHQSTARINGSLHACREATVVAGKKARCRRVNTQDSACSNAHAQWHGMHLHQTASMPKCVTHSRFQGAP